MVESVKLEGGKLIGVRGKKNHTPLYEALVYNMKNTRIQICTCTIANYSNEELSVIL